MSRYVKSISITGVQRRRAPSKHYVYVIEVTWSDGSVIPIFRRYSQFFDFHVKMLDDHPLEAGTSPDGPERIIPFLPGKKLFGRSHTKKVAESRIGLLDEYLVAVVNLPEKLSRSNHVLSFFEATNTDIKPPSQEEREKKPPNMLKKLINAAKDGDQDQQERDIEIGGIMSLDQYRAVADYKKQDRTEMTLKTGDIIDVVEKNDNGWWFVERDDSRGWVPATYLEPVGDPDQEEPHNQPVPDADEKYITTSAYKAENDDEIGYEKGVLVTVLEKKLDGWWRVSYQDKVGWTPGSFLAKFEGHKAAKDLTVSTADSPSGSPQLRKKKNRAPPRRESIRIPDTIHKDKGAFAAILAKRRDTGDKDAVKPPRPSSPKAAGGPKPARPRPASPSAKKPVGAAKPPRPAAPASGDKPKTAPTKPKPPRPQGPRPGAASGASAKHVKATQGYEAEGDTNVSFPQGAVMEVIEESDTGWTYVSYKGQEGWAPTDFLEPASSGAMKLMNGDTPQARRQTAAARKPGGLADVLSGRAQTMAQGSAAAKPPRPGGPVLPSKPKPPVQASKPSAVSSNSDAPRERQGTVAGLAAKLAAGGGLKPAGGAPKPAGGALKPPAAAAKPAKPPMPRPPTAKTASATSSDTKTQCRVLQSYTAEDDSTVSVREGQTVDLVEKSDTGWWCVSVNGKEGWAPADFLEVVAATSSKPAKPPLPKAAAKPAIGGGSGVKSALRPPMPGGSKPALSKKPATAVRPSVSGPKPAMKPKPKQGSSPLKEDEYYAIDSYTAEGDVELSIAVGQRVTILDKADGWWFASRGGKEGWAPADFFSKEAPTA